MISIVIISKDEPDIDGTLTDITAQAQDLEEHSEIVVIDASEGRLDLIRQRHEPAVRWEQFRPPPGVSVPFPSAQRRRARSARGDHRLHRCRLPAGAGWLKHLVYPLNRDEQVTAGLALTASGDPGLYGRAIELARTSRYLTMSHHQPRVPPQGIRRGRRIRREVCLRLRCGLQLAPHRRRLPHPQRSRRGRPAARLGDMAAAVASFLYLRPGTGPPLPQAPRRVRHFLRNDPTVVVYPVFLLGLPLTVIFPLYPALLLIPAWRNRSMGAARVVADHITFGAGVLAELVRR